MESHDQGTGERLAWITQAVRDFWALSPHNTLGPDSGEKAWDEPLLACSRGDDPFYDRIKADLGDFYWTPADAFRLAYPAEPAAADELTVITWVLPQTAATKQEQRRETTLPGRRWSRSRFYGEQFNCELRLHLAGRLTEAGIAAVAPERLPEFGYRRSKTFGLASNWSERHAAFIAGLGTFGLSDGLITPRGKAVRIGSVVARLNLPATPRPYPSHQQWCLWYAKGTCGVCIKRCPADAIGSEGHDKDRCHDYIRAVTAPHARQHYGVEATPCGLCQVAVPCESRNPTENLK